jgi:D-amino-acid dehydrogenase
MIQQTETLVIGGGAVGICSSYYLNKLGKNVAVLEKGDICSGSSHGNAGLIVPSHSIPLAAPGVVLQGIKWMFKPTSPFYIKPRFQIDFLSWLWKFRSACNRHHVHGTIPVLRDLSFASLELFDELATLEESDFGFERAGLIELFKTQKEFKHRVKEARLLRQCGIENRIIQPNELKEFMGDMRTNVVGGAFFPRDARLIPERFVHQLGRFVQNRGVNLLTSVEIIGFETAGRRVKAVKTTRGDISVAEVVLAGGAWSADIARHLQFKLWVEPAKGYSLTFKRPSQCPATPFNLAEARVFCTPMADMVRFSGTLELCGFDLSIDRRRTRAILDSVPEYLPDFDPHTLELLEIWRGLRPCSPDGLPFIGRAPGYDNVIMATGHGMLGISLAPISGKIVSQLSANEKPAIDITPLSVDRFN